MSQPPLTSQPTLQPPATLPSRLACIDVLRGLDMFFLVGAGEVLRRLIKALNTDALLPLYNQLDHVQWEGFTAWDLIMPLFLFTSGLSMPFSLGKMLERGDPKPKIYAKILKRFLLLFVLGWVVQGNLLDLNPATFQIYCNTLHSIAVGYLITALIVLNAPKPAAQLALGASLLVAYWALLAYVPVPGHGPGSFTPDGNLAMYIDRVVFGSFRNQTPTYAYTWLLSSLGFAATVYSGYYAGQILKKPLTQNHTHNQKLLHLTLIGLALLLAAFLLSYHTPIIKKIWTASMVLHSSGLSFLLLALCYLLTDKLALDTWWTRTLRVFGLNAIAAYLLYTVLQLDKIAQYLTHGLSQYTAAYYPLFVALCKFAILYLIIRHMYKHKIFLKI